MANGLRAVTACAPWKAALSFRGLGSSLLVTGPVEAAPWGDIWAEGGARKSGCSAGREPSLPTLIPGAWLEVQTPCPASMELSH